MWGWGGQLYIMKGLQILLAQGFLRPKFGCGTSRDQCDDLLYHEWTVPLNYIPFHYCVGGHDHTIVSWLEYPADVGNMYLNFVCESLVFFLITHDHICAGFFAPLIKMC